METISLHGFAKTHNLAKSSVHSRCRELGIDTSNGLDEAAIATLKAEFGLNDRQFRLTPGADRPAAPSAVHEVEVEPGGGLTTIQPSLPTQFDLSRIRCGGDVATIDDPLAVATQFLQVADQLKAAMGQDLALREAKIQQTRQAREAIAAKASELQLEQRLYQLQVGNADQVLSQETDALTQALQTLQTVGKPTAGQ